MPHCPKVCVYFDNKLMRGNRTVKVSAGSLHAFDSPNLPPLARAHVDIDVDQGTVLRPASMARFRVVDTVCQEVRSCLGLLYLWIPACLPRLRCCVSTPRSWRARCGTSCSCRCAAWCCSATGPATSPQTGHTPHQPWPHLGSYFLSAKS